ncbi:MAG: response regulator [Deltaproteobacteria bacterium]|nr:MAG: response regulator [Deltaproteobacteria bacterium]
MVTVFNRARQLQSGFAVFPTDHLREGGPEVMTQRILVVDDEESIRFTFDAFLTDAGYRVDTAPSLKDALNLAEATTYDTVFLDILLGRESGMQMLRYVRETNPNCPVVMITGAPEIATAAEAVRLGAFDYLTKPVHQDELLRIARRALERKALLDEQETFRLRMAAVFQSIQEGILVFDEAFRLVDVNDSARRMLACDKDVVGKTLDELAASEDCRVARQFQEIVEQRCLGEIYRMQMTNMVGRQLLVSLTMAPLTSQVGRETGVVLVLRDEGQPSNGAHATPS